MKYQYFLVHETYAYGDIVRKSYGLVAATTKNNEIAVVESYSDVCSDFELIDQFVKNCNRLSLSIIHFEDTVDDFLKNL